MLLVICCQFILYFIPESYDCLVNLLPEYSPLYNYILMQHVVNCACLLACLYSQIKQESFLEDISNLLNSGEVPNLYPADERADLCEKMRILDRYTKHCYV